MYYYIMKIEKLGEDRLMLKLHLATAESIVEEVIKEVDGNGN